MYKGKVSTIDGAKARVVFPDRENIVSNPLLIASHVTDLTVGDNVAVEFFNGNMSDGLIIAKFEVSS